MSNQLLLTNELVQQPIKFKNFLSSIFRPSERETDNLLLQAIEAGASNLQLFNLAGACYANQKFGAMRQIDIENFDYISEQGGFNYYLPKNKTVKLYRGLNLTGFNKSRNTYNDVKDFIFNKRREWESWTLNKDVARFFARDEGFILETTLNTGCCDVLGLNIYGHLPEAEIIIQCDELDFEIEYVCGVLDTNCWQKNYEWLKNFFQKI